MSRYAELLKNKVRAIYDADLAPTLPKPLGIVNLTALSLSDPKIGSSWNGTEFTDPPTKRKRYTYAEFLNVLSENELDSFISLKRGDQGAQAERFLEFIKAQGVVDFNGSRTYDNIQSLIGIVFADQARIDEITG